MPDVRGIAEVEPGVTTLLGQHHHPDSTSFNAISSAPDKSMTITSENANGDPLIIEWVSVKTTKVYKAVRTMTYDGDNHLLTSIDTIATQ